MKTFTKNFTFLPAFICLTAALLYQGCSRDDDPEPPQADFTYTSDNGFRTPSTITFVNTSKAASEYHWDFGDDSPASSEQHPEHLYETPGTYTVTLTARNGGLSDTKTVTIEITPHDPVADFSFVSNNDFYAPSTITFTNTSLHATTYSWNFGDGSEASSEKDPVHIYAQPGTYTVTLTAINETLQDEKTATFDIQAGMPQAAFTFTSDNDFIAPSAIAFTNASVNATGFSWDFGDGSEPSDEQNPLHSFTSPGTYTVTLSVSNEGGSDSHSETIEIKAQPYTGTYRLISAALTQDLTIGPDTYPAGTDVSDVALGLFAVVPCPSRENVVMDLRYNNDVYFICSENTQETKAGTWIGNAEAGTLALSFTSPPYPQSFSVTLKNISMNGSMLTSELIDQSMEGAVIGFPGAGLVVVNCSLRFEKTQ